MDYPKFARINEEGPREGFQIEPGPIPSARKIELIDSLSKTGLAQIQIASFVNPRAVPGMADSFEVAQGFKRHAGVLYTALWLNDKGLKRALDAKTLDVRGALALTASNEFLLRNQKRTQAEDIEAQREMLCLYLENGVPLERVVVMAAFGCNFEADIPVSRVVGQVGQMMEIVREQNVPTPEICLADTMGWASPASIRRVVGAVREQYPQARIALHLHDTRGLAVANASAGLEVGVSVFDAAVGGLGGCPFAGHKGAAGNICTEDLVFMCHELGIDTGVDLEAIIESARLAEEIVGHPLPGSVMKGGSLRSYRQAAGRSA